MSYDEQNRIQPDDVSGPRYQCEHSMQSWYIKDAMPRCHDCDDNAKAKTKGATVSDESTGQYHKQAKALLEPNPADTYCDCAHTETVCEHCEAIARVAVALQEASAERGAHKAEGYASVDALELAAYGHEIVGTRLSLEQRVDRLVAQVGWLRGFRDAVQLLEAAK